MAPVSIWLGYNVDLINNKGPMPFWKGFGPIGRFKEIVQPWKSGWWISRIYCISRHCCTVYDWLPVCSFHFEDWQHSIGPSIHRPSIVALMFEPEKNHLVQCVTDILIRFRKKLPKVFRDRFSMMEVAHFWHLRSFFPFFWRKFV